MVRVSAWKVKTAANEIWDTDRGLKRRVESIEEIILQCRNLGLTKEVPELQKVSEDIKRHRRVLQELILSLDNIAELYTRCEETIAEHMEGAGNRAVRAVSWVDISFSTETMELINQISA